MPNEKIPIYKGKHTVERIFDDRNHYYGVDGQEKTSVTTVLNVIASPILEAWKIKMTAEYIKKTMAETFPDLPVKVINTICDDGKKAHRSKADEAARIGKIVHDWLEQYSFTVTEGKPNPPMPKDPEAILAVGAFLRYAKDNIKRFIFAERVVYSESVDFIGTLDAVVEMKDGSIVLLDYKTSGGIYEKYYAQLGAYYLALVEELQISINQAIILRIGKDGVYEEAMIPKSDLIWLAKGFVHVAETMRYNEKLKRYAETKKQSQRSK